MSTQTVNIPLGDVDTQIEIEIESSDVESAVEYWLERNFDSNETDVTEEVTNMLNEYIRQQENSRTTCEVGRAFEKAVAYASLKALKNLVGQG